MFDMNASDSDDSDEEEVKCDVVDAETQKKECKTEVPVQKHTKLASRCSQCLLSLPSPFAFFLP